MKLITIILLMFSFSASAAEECELKHFMWKAPTQNTDESDLLEGEITRFNISCNGEPLIEVLGGVREYEVSMCGAGLYACNITVTTINTSAPADFNEFTIEDGGPTDPPSDVTPKAIDRLKVQ